jgi:hypothetical protein
MLIVTAAVGAGLAVGLLFLNLGFNCGPCGLRPGSAIERCLGLARRTFGVGDLAAQNLLFGFSGLLGAVAAIAVRRMLKR